MERLLKASFGKKRISTRDFIQNNYTQYDGDESFLEGPTEATNSYGENYKNYKREERCKGWSIRYGYRSCIIYLHHEP